MELHQQLHHELSALYAKILAMCYLVLVSIIMLVLLLCQKIVLQNMLSHKSIVKVVLILLIKLRGMILPFITHVNVLQDQVEWLMVDVQLALLARHVMELLQLAIVVLIKNLDQRNIFL